MGNKQPADDAEIDAADWPPTDETVLAKLNKGRNCPLTLNEENVATFAMGWFWGPEARFSSKKGALWTRVGYTGSKNRWPTYQKISGHTEAVQVKYDGKNLTYEMLLDEFFDEANYYSFSYSTQYKSGIWWHGEEQQQAVLKKIEQIKQTKKGAYANVKCTIEPLGTFYRAEEYHQRYYAKLKH